MYCVNVRPENDNVLYDMRIQRVIMYFMACVSCERYFTI